MVGMRKMFIIMGYALRPKARHSTVTDHKATVHLIPINIDIFLPLMAY
jgi:hypothetical protein